MNDRQQFILKRLGLTLVSLYLIITVLFLLFRVMPGSPTSQVMSMGMSPADRAQLQAQYGLDEPLYTQYVLYMKSLLTGKLGISFLNNKPVLGIVLDGAINTLSIALPSVILAFTLGPIIGVYIASHRGSLMDDTLTSAVLTSYAAPVFWSGMLLLMLFSFTLGWLPSSGMHSPGYISTSLVERFVSVDFLRHAILPIVVFTAWWLSIPTLIMRNNVVEVLSSDFIQLQRTEGLSNTSILYRHAARNALLPVLHRAALAVAVAFSGSVIIEVLFSWPGLGRVIWRSTLRQDYPLAQGSFFFVAIIVITMNYIADVVSVYIDPRIAVEEEQA
jgi:peptide/nickel transport system permease protein